MKTQSILKTAFLAAAFTAFTLIGNTSAQVLNPDSVVNVQFGGTTLTSYSPTVSPLAYTGNVWNNQPSDTGSSLAYADGTLGNSGIGFSLSGGGYAETSNTANGETSSLPLLANILYGFGMSATSPALTISGLDDSKTYDIAIASNSSFAADGFTLATGGATQTVTTAQLATWVDGQNYVEFDNVAPTSNSIVIDITPDSYAGGTVILNGFQVGSVESAPEPSTAALLGLGALGIAFLIRRHRTA